MKEDPKCLKISSSNKRNGIFENKIMDSEFSEEETEIKDKKQEKMELVWKNIILFIYIHSAALYGLYLLIFQCHFTTFAWNYAVAFWGGLGITAGSHRLWAHKSYKAKYPLRLFLAIGQTLSLQNSIYEWCRDHRVHHKFSETDADPHNAKRGFFFSHMGWLLCKKHDDVRTKGKTVDLSDLEADPIVAIQKKYYEILVVPLTFIFPAIVPWYFWGVTFSDAFHLGLLRYVLSLHGTWAVNSFAHLYGRNPYDKNINPSENKYVSYFAFGEGWHNYHHVFPWDYKAAEVGFYQYNPSTWFINGMAKIGQAYDLKTVPKDIVIKRIKRTGDFSQHSSNLGAKSPNDTANANNNNHHHHHTKEELVWGWDDEDIPEQNKQVTETLYSSLKARG